MHRGWCGERAALPTWLRRSLVVYRLVAHSRLGVQIPSTDQTIPLIPSLSAPAQCALPPSPPPSLLPPVTEARAG